VLPHEMENLRQSKSAHVLYVMLSTLLEVRRLEFVELCDTYKSLSLRARDNGSKYKDLV